MLIEADTELVETSLLNNESCEYEMIRYIYTTRE